MVTKPTSSSRRIAHELRGTALLALHADRNHWVLAAFSTSTRTIDLYDSLSLLDDELLEFDPDREDIEPKYIEDLEMVFHKIFPDEDWHQWL